MLIAGLYLLGVALICAVSATAESMGFNPALWVLVAVCGWAGADMLWFSASHWWERRQYRNSRNQASSLRS